MVYPYKEKWLENTKQYTWTDDIPKSALLVKLNPGISSDEREFILNGIRNNLAKTDFIFDKHTI